MTARSAVAVVAALSLSACGAPLMKSKLKLPAGPGATAPDAAGALAEALGRCQAVRTLTAEVAVSGTSRGRRLRAKLTAGVAAPASVRLEAVAAFGQPLFIFVAAESDATLWLPRDQRVVEHARPDVVLDAVAGVPLDAADLRATLTGCAPETPDAAGARAFGETWRVVPAARGGQLYLNREGTAAPWRLVAVIGGGDGRTWRADYHDFQQDFPRVVRVTSPGSSAFDLQLALSQVNINAPLASGAFLVSVPESAERITVDELRQSGPLARQTGASDGR
jgi:hypothetical protein